MVLTRTDSGVPPRWRCYHRMLVAYHDQLVRQREERSAALHTALERAGTDAADVALAQRENGEILAAISAEDTELEEIKAAVGRIHDGTYGICQATGRAISAERLRAIPWTRFCREAAAARERRPACAAADVYARPAR